jgi:hypothetical protein
MSYYTEIEFTFADEGPDFEAVLSRARSYLEAQGRESAVDFILEQLRHALEEEKGDFKGLWSEDIDGLMEHVSAGFPGLVFYVRGMGEEFADVWLRLYRDGTIVFRVGPFEEDLDRSSVEAETDDD